MAYKVTAQIGRDHYQTTITAGTNSLIADEPVSNGGTYKGLAPHELLLASLGACTSITLRMYADRKQWNLESIQVNLELERDEENNITNITRNIALTGNLSEEERQRMLNIANKCPVHKTLTSTINIESKLV